MRFMTMVKSAERVAAPPPALMEAVARLGEEASRAGAMVGMGGFLPIAMGARIRLAAGSVQVQEGPFTDSEERIGGYAVWSVGSKREAIEWSVRFLMLHLEHWLDWEGEIELRQLFEAPAGDSVVR